MALACLLQTKFYSTTWQDNGIGVNEQGAQPFDLDPHSGEAEAALGQLL
jgi:hypothetical protein